MTEKASLLEQIEETEINIISQSTRLEGKIQFDRITRVHGVLIGEIHSRKGSHLILSETALVEGNIEADTLLIDGFVRGDIHTHGKVTISRTGRVVGNITTPKLELEFGSYFEGRCSMESVRTSPAPVPAAALEPSPA